MFLHNNHVINIHQVFILKTCKSVIVVQGHHYPTLHRLINNIPKIRHYFYVSAKLS